MILRNPHVDAQTLKKRKGESTEGKVSYTELNTSMFLCFCSDLLWNITQPKERDLSMCCEAPFCKKVIMSPLLECGVCNKKIHAKCDPKTMNRKKKTLKLVRYYCSFH